MTGPLIEVDELAGLLAGRIDEDPQPLVLADVRWQLGGPPGEPEFEAGHLPGARYVDLETELSGPAGPSGGRHPLPDPDTFAAAMRRLGVGRDSLVVIYDDARSLPAARLWWLLLDAGHERVRVLNGGLGAWTAAGRPLESGPARPVAAGDFAGRPGSRATIDAAALADRIEKSGAGSGDDPGPESGAGSGPVIGPVVDVRAYDRFTGSTEPMDPVAGHIPGAVSAPSMANLDEQGRFLPTDQIRDRYRQLDEAGGEPVFYCGSGITAAHTLLARASAGLDRGLIYPGSWSDWITDPSRPVADGDADRY